MTDPQSRAFREATDDDLWRGNIEDLIADHGAVYHNPIQGPIERSIILPHFWEEYSWDERRLDPKTREQAKEALNGRITDPTAPDDESVRGAYDG